MDEARSNQRSSRLVRGSMTGPDDMCREILIHNVSCHGIGAKFSGGGVKPGDKVLLDLPTLGNFHGTVRWLRDGRIGIELEEPLSPEAIKFHNEQLSAKKDTAYKVPERFKPMTNPWRPGFGKK